MNQPNRKILIVTYFFPPAIGGIENYYHNLCQLLGGDSVVVLTQNHPEASIFDAKQNYHIYRTDFFGGKMTPKWWHLKKEIQEIIQKEGITHIIFGHFHPYCLLGKSLKLPYFVFGHGTDIALAEVKFVSKWAFRRVYQSSQSFIANSQYLAQKMANIAQDKAKIKVIYPGVDYEALNKPVENIGEYKRILGLEDNNLIMLSSGRLVGIKNYAAIIKLMPALLEQLPKLKYLIMGDGPEFENLNNLIKELSLTDHVKLLGHINDDPLAKASYYQMAHIFVGVTTQPEGFGISYLEAQACRTPVIASKFGGSAEAVIDGQTGILVDPNKVAEIYSAILRLGSDKELWQRMADAAHTRVKNEFSLDKQLAEFNKIIL
ncbi:MAG: glycosyltransferase family 4 protein [Patescibacteria group bacterium]|jgi:phosphatidylinositol alpha-1,6-mannosyltransferase